MVDHDVLLVDREPVLNAVAEPLKEDARIALEGVDGLAVGPPAPLVEGERQVKVEHRDDGRDVMGEKFVNERLVERHALLVDLSHAIGDDARPGDREAVRLHAHLRHEGDVLAEAVVVVARDLEIRHTRHRLVEVLHGHALAILVPRALDLVGRGGSTPQEVIRKRLEP